MLGDAVGRFRYIVFALKPFAFAAPPRCAPAIAPGDRRSALPAAGRRNGAGQRCGRRRERGLVGPAAGQRSRTAHAPPPGCRVPDIERPRSRSLARRRAERSPAAPAPLSIEVLTTLPSRVTRGVARHGGRVRHVSLLVAAVGPVLPRAGSSPCDELGAGCNSSPASRAVTAAR